MGFNIWFNIVFNYSRCYQEPSFKVSSKSVRWQLRYCCHWVSVVVGWYAKSFSCLTQLKVMLGWVELWLSWGLWQHHSTPVQHMELIWIWSVIDVYFISLWCVSYLQSIWNGSYLDGTSHYRPFWPCSIPFWSHRSYWPYWPS